jgi:hypothetical protein
MARSKHNVDCAKRNQKGISKGITKGQKQNKGPRRMRRNPLLKHSLHQIGATRFELATSASRTQRSIQAELRPADVKLPL